MNVTLYVTCALQNETNICIRINIPQDFPPKNQYISILIYQNEIQLHPTCGYHTFYIDPSFA